MSQGRQELNLARAFADIFRPEKGRLEGMGTGRYTSYDTGKAMMPTRQLQLQRAPAKVDENGNISFNLSGGTGTWRIFAVWACGFELQIGECGPSGSNLRLTPQAEQCGWTLEKNNRIFRYPNQVQYFPRREDDIKDI